MPMDNVTLENTQQSISSRDAKSVASVMVNGKWINLSDTLEQTNVKSDVGAVSKQVAEQQTVITSTVAQADSAVAYANDAIEKSRVNSQAIVAQSEAISEAKSAMDSATAEIQQAIANAASDAANIRADVAQVQNEVDTAKAANSASVEALKSDVSATKQDLADVHDSLTKAQAAAEDSQKAIGKSIAQINSDIEHDREDIASAQQANADTAKQLDAYSKQAQDQGKTIKSIQDKQDGFTTTLADVQGNVTQVSDKVDGLSANLKDAQNNVASVKAQADQLSATLTDHAKSIATLTASAKEVSSTLEDADGRLSKVEQTAKTNSSTLSDVQGDLSQVKQDATTLTSTLKGAQGNISTLQQKADSVSAQLASAQGDITSLQTDVKGIKATLVSHEGDIHTLQADSKTLKDNMQDVQGNISTLQKTSTDVTSELQDHAGRISKVEQTASTLTNEFSDQQGHLNQVEQTATGTQQTVANQQGQINSIQTDVSGIHETITGQGNQIATINVTLNGLDTKYEGVSGDLNNLKSQAQWVTVTDTVDLNNIKTPCHEFLKGAVTNAPNETAWWYLTVEGSEGDRITQTVIADQSNNRYTRRLADSWSAWVRDATQTDVTALSGQVTTNTTQITQNKQAIALKADQSTVDKLSGEVSQNTAQLKVQADQISSKVSSSDFKTLNDKVNGAISSIQKNSTAIDQTNKQISLKADQTEVDQVKQTATQNSSRLDVMDGKISSKVTSKDVNNIVDSKGFATTNTVQSLITQKADDWNVNLTKLKNDTQTSLTNLAIGVEGVQAQVYNSDGSSKITQLSNVVQSKVSQGDYNSQINQLKNDINLRVQKGDVISQINQEAGGNTLIQVSNGNGSLILDAANTIVKGKEWIPVAAIADLTADQVQAGTLKGVKVDFRDSTGTGMIADGSTLTFDVSNTPAGYLSYNGMPVAELPDGSGGNELAIRYGLSTAIIPDDNSGAQATFSKAAQKIAYMTGTSRGKKMLSGLEVHSNNHHWLCAVNSDATCNRFEVNDHDGLNIAWHDNTHFFISDGNAKLYKDNDDSPTATKLEVHGWAWVNGWVEAAGHSQHSALSTKTDIQAIDDDEMLAMVNNTDLASFLFKTDVASGETHRHIGLIIDDVHDVAQYQAPQDFIAPNGVSRDDDNMIGALFGAVKALTKRIKTLESKVG
ncbi:tail fiber domain-containing protein [Limosilactobacillus fermentum]